MQIRLKQSFRSIIWAILCFAIPIVSLALVYRVPFVIHGTPLHMSLPWIVAILAAASPFLWMILVTPWLIASHRSRFSEDYPPAAAHRDFQLRVWGASFIACAAAVGVGSDQLFGLFHDGMPLSGIEIWSFIITAAIAVGYSITASRYGSRRIRKLAQEQDICFACGYCCKGVESANCPECGLSIPHDGSVHDDIWSDLPVSQKQRAS